ncbi:MAG: TetR/AcrR family transcriptional regulator [Phycisphaerales bacterium]
MARPRSFDESAVLEAARDLFWLSGYSATSMDEMMAATGLGKGSLYAAFGGKHQLFLKVFDDYCAGAVRNAERDLLGNDDEAMTRLIAYVERLVEATALDDARRGCLLANATAERSRTDEAIVARAKATIERLEALLASCVSAAQRAGDLDPDADADQLAALLLAVLRGVEALGKAGRDPETLRSIGATALALLPSTTTPR